VALTLLTHGCPIQAAVVAFGLDERTVAAWQHSAGRYARRFHQLHVQRARVGAQHVEADELWDQMVGRKPWLALALAVPTRLWLGGVLSRRRDLRLITSPVVMVRGCLKRLAVLVCVDGLTAYVRTFRSAFRHKVQGRRGR
jgi:hypothetical protein